MNIPYIDSILLGLVRLLLWIGFFYALKRLLYKEEASSNQVKTVVYAYAVYGSFALIIIHFLVLFSAYDFFTCLILLLCFLVIKYLDLGSAISNKRVWEDKRKIMLLKVLENVEDKDPIIDVHTDQPLKRLIVNEELIIAMITALTAVLIRVFLMKEDTYQLSSAWFTELNIIKEFGQGKWLSGDPQIGGQYALMSLYAMFTGITDEMALESFGLVQSLFLSLLIFWVMTVLTNSRITIPLISALLFALFFNLAPTDLSLLTHAKRTWMALTFTLPAFLFIIKPSLLYDRLKNGYFVCMLALFLVIGFTNIFTFVILIPPFLALSVLLFDRENKSQFKLAISAYLISLVTLTGIYWIKCVIADISFGGFIAERLISVSTYTRTTNLLIPYDRLILMLQVLSGVMLVIMGVLFRGNRKKWSAPILFLLYFNAILIIFKIDFAYLDTDLLNEVLPIFIPIVLGLAAYLLYNFRSTETEISSLFRTMAIFLVIGSLAYYSQKELFLDKTNDNPGSKELIDAYQRIKSDYLDYSYAVVNVNATLPLSKGSQHFITYLDFTQDYPERDSVYFAKKEDKFFMKQNPRYILPASVMVFIYNEENPVKRIGLRNQRMNQVKETLQLLRMKGRKIDTILKNEFFEVVLIENSPGESKIDELL